MSFEQIWANADPDAVSGSDDNLEPPPDGVYIVFLIGAGAFVSKSGQPFVKLVFRRPEDEYTWSVLLGFKSQSQANMTKRQVRDLGVDVDAIASLEEVDTALKGRVGEFFSVTVKTTGQFRNTYVDGPATTGQPASDVPSDVPEAVAQPVTVPVGDDQVPF